MTVTEYQVPGLRSVKVYSGSDVGISWSSSSPEKTLIYMKTIFLPLTVTM